MYCLATAADLYLLLTACSRLFFQQNLHSVLYINIQISFMGFYDTHGNTYVLFYGEMH